MQLSKLTILAAVLFAFMGSPALAQDTQNVETVILASTENYPDALMAASAANKIGAPILLTERDALPEDTRQALTRLQPSEVVVVGGTAVVSEAVVSDLQQDYNVTRLWGTTRYGTGVEVAENFWIEGADEAILVQNDLDDASGRLLAAAKELARENDAPVYLTPEDSVPAIVQSSLENLGVQRVTLIGRTVSSDYRSAVTDLGITIEEEITGTSEDEVADRIRDRVTQRLNASSTLVVVASRSNEHAMAAANFPNSVVYHVTDDDETDGVVQVVNDHNISDIKVVGRPDLAADVADALREETDATVDRVFGGPREAVRMNANLTRDNIPSFARANRERMADWRHARQERMEHVRIRVNHTIQKADELIDANSSDEAQEALAEARLHHSQGDYEDAWEEAHEAINAQRSADFRDGRLTAQERQRAIQEETEDLQKRVQELQRLNRAFAQELQDPNLTTEERLEIIETFRHKRQERVQALIEEARQLRSQDGDLAERLREAENRVRTEGEHTRFKFRAECTDESAERLRVTRNAVSGHDGRISVRGRVLMPTPNYQAAASFEDPSERTLEVTIALRERDSLGVQCVGVGEYRYDIDTAAGNWTVNVRLTVDGDEVYSTSETVTVAREDDDASDDETSDDDVKEETRPASEVSSADVQEPGVVAVAGHTGEHAGYVVIHRDDGGSPGVVVGRSGLVSDRFETRVEYNSTASRVFWAMLHHDDGDGTYEFPGNDSPVRTGEGIVQKKFDEPRQEDTSDVMPAAFTLSSTEDVGDCDTVSFHYDGDAVDTITLKAGTEYTVTFAPREGCTYGGGAEYRSRPDSVFGTSDAVQGGEMTAVTFTPEEDFVVTQYWPGSDISKADVAVDVVR